MRAKMSPMGRFWLLKHLEFLSSQMCHQVAAKVVISRFPKAPLCSLIFSQIMSIEKMFWISNLFGTKAARSDFENGQEKRRCSAVSSLSKQIAQQGTLAAVREWYRDYKIPEGKQPNRFGFSNKALNKDYALEVIMKTNESWRKLVEGSVPSGELSLV